jgi:hypothetical protein
LLKTCFLDVGEIDYRNQSFTTCIPWYFPFNGDTRRVCNPWEADEFQNAFQNINFDTECKQCLPDCEHTLYRYKIYTEPIRECNENNFGMSHLCNYMNKPKNLVYWGEQVIEELQEANVSTNMSSYLNNLKTSKRINDQFQVFLFGDNSDVQYESYEEDLAYLNIYFDQTTALQFKTQASQSWAEYFANVGGVLGLCIGLCIVTIFELVWIIFRIADIFITANYDVWRKKLIAGWQKIHQLARKIIDWTGEKGIKIKLKKKSKVKKTYIN